MKATHSLGLGTLLLLTLPTGPLAAAPPADTICVTEFPLAGSGGSGVDFGRAVAVDGERAVVCGDLEAYAYSWSGGAWVQEAVLTIPGAESGFGASAALSGDTALIGLPLQDGASADEGRALVFVRDGAGVWTLQAELTTLDAEADDRFGLSVALDGERALIGAPRDDAAGVDTGSAYVFERSGTLWSEVAKIVPSSPGAVRFGTSVALSGGTALVGSAQFVGGIFAYVEVAGLWTLEADLAPLLILPSQVALDGDRALLGGLFESLVLERAGGLWSEAGQLAGTASTVALDGDVAVLGRASCPSAPAASVFVFDGLDWVESAGLQLAGSLMPVALSGLRAVVGTRGGLACSGGVASGFAFVLAPPPSVAHRNAGTNPDSYTALSGSYGETLDLTIDLTTTGHTLGLVIGFDSPFQLTLGGGQTLLCLDLGGNGELVNTGFFAGPLVHRTLNIPNDPVYAGYTVCTQAIHAFGVTPFALSNAQDITIGGCP